MRRLLAFTCALALGFAPVPFPKPGGRAKGAITVEELVGTWRIVRNVWPPDRTPRPLGPDDFITFTRTQWSYGTVVTYDLRLDGSKRPAEFDLMRAGQGTPYGRGVIRRDGNRLQLAYTFDKARPGGFEGLTQGCVLTLERVKR